MTRHGLPSLYRTQLRETMEDHLSTSQAAVQQVLKREELPYFTQNGHYLSDGRET